MLLRLIDILRKKLSLTERPSRIFIADNHPGKPDIWNYGLDEEKIKGLLLETGYRHDDIEWFIDQVRTHEMGASEPAALKAQAEKIRNQMMYKVYAFLLPAKEKRHEALEPVASPVDLKTAREYLAAGLPRMAQKGKFAQGRASIRKNLFNDIK
ncbi:MAG: hypothetical protein HQL16_07370, partial [Candidatus Omnitrophica bacterium]|nr:hypothetical protein [Candidatus Omnitrophota bacterium]